MKKCLRGLVLALFFAAPCCFVLPEAVSASQWYGDGWYDDEWSDNEWDTWDTTDEETSDDSSWQDFYEGDTQEESMTVYYGQKGVFESPASWTDRAGVNVPITSKNFSLENSWDTILTLDEQGGYEVTGVGSATVEGRFYDASGRLLLTRTYDITAKIDMQEVTLNKTSAKSYVQKSYYYSSAQFEFRLKDPKKHLPSNVYDDELSCTSSNSEMYVDAYMSDGNTIIVNVQGTGKTTVTLVINEKKFKVKLHVIAVGINKNSLLLPAGQTSQLKLSGLKEGIKWSSSNPGVVKVSRDGTVKALRNGNAVIKAKVGDISLGCAVSVVSQNRYKAICKAVSIAKTSSYSQPKRMQKGYYDCSSLTWTAYKQAGISFGNSYYAPVAADQAKWCVQKKQNIKGGLSTSNIRNMRLNAGDLMFEEGENNGRYRNIYHVEMIRGYVCYGFDEKEKPILGIAWANRPDDYYLPGGQMVCRPQ